MSINTVVVDPKQLHSIWPFVRRGLEAIKKKSATAWIPEDVYGSLRGGNAVLLLGMCDQRPVGFAIYYFVDEAFTNNKELFIWITWTLPPRERYPYEDVNAAIAHTMSAMVQIAKQAKCHHIACLSSRPGFEKFVGPMGFEKGHSAYRLIL